MNDLFSEINTKPNNSSSGFSSIDGEISSIVFASEDGNYWVVKITIQTGNIIVATGSQLNLSPGQLITANGKWKNHKDHGRQFQIDNFRVTLPKSTKGIKKYLSSGAISGVGKATAEKIVNKFGTETIKILDQYSTRLNEVEGLGKSKIKRIKESWNAVRESRELDIFLHGIGLTPSNCKKLRQHYGHQTAKVVRETPYRLATEIAGIGFLTADRLALAQNLPVDSPIRISAGIVYSLKQLSSEGHTCFPREELTQYAAKLLQLDPSLVDHTVGIAVATDQIILEKINGTEFLYLKQLYKSERALAKKVVELLKTPMADLSKNIAISDKFTDGQKAAINAAFSHRITIITGGPGVGKTTVVSDIVANAKKLNMNIKLAAPTGRAAKRMQEGCYHHSQTIHRLLHWDATEGGFAYNSEKPLKCDLLIVDEISMLDTRLAQAIFNAIGYQTRLVLVGDKDQLPSIGAGSVLHDFIESNLIKVSYLTDIFRQAAGSRIITNAHHINNRQLPDLRNPQKEDLADFYWIEKEDPDAVNELISTMLSERIPERFKLNPVREIQVLTPMNNGVNGTHNLNTLIQDKVNPNRKTPQINFGDKKFRLHDKVMQKVNNYDKSVFNGDLGFITAIDNKKKTFVVGYDGHNVEYEFDEVDQLMLAYAITIHKSQGSEFPAVIIPVLTQHFVMLQKKLIYTAMTRAKRLLIMIGTKKALRLCISNLKEKKRYSNLTFFLSFEDANY